MASATRHIVVGVDDDFRVRESIESLMESAGYAPRVFGSGEEFLRSGALGGATCLITDVRMPGMDGIELQRRVRLERPKLPVIFITAHHDEQIRKRALDEGAVGVLYKPFDASDLLKAIEAVLADVEEV
ncbi:MAG TPA: response regulator [Bryobacteraceae bacterium]|nr:response regulator [Bryobacteraceae bacterium]